VTLHTREEHSIIKQNRVDDKRFEDQFKMYEQQLNAGEEQEDDGIALKL